MRFLHTIILLLATLAASALEYPEMELRGTNISWDAGIPFNRDGNKYTLTVAHLDGHFKVTSDRWVYNYGASETVTGTCSFPITPDGPNIVADNLNNVTITFTVNFDAQGNLLPSTMYIAVEGDNPPEPVHASGTLPVLYINVYLEGTDVYDNEIISRNLAHKEYFNGEYWLDLNGCQWLADEGAASIGSKEEPLPLQIKARGNFTRTAFAKKPFKLKLGAKQKMLGLSKSKHFALLAHADDNFGYLRNFTGFNLGKRIGLPWTPSQQPVEVVINGDYRGLYFLTESIRIEGDRVNITELPDLCEDPELISGGYLVELDNYDETNQIRMEEKSCVSGYWLDMLRVTWDTPEDYSTIQQRFITDQFSAMNNYVGACDPALWQYLDIDDAVRYYIVEEIISHTEAFHGSTYLFRDRGEGQKWHFSPLWDCGNAFNGPTDGYFYDHSPFGSTWIPSFRAQEPFNTRLRSTWKWFMSNCYDGIEADIATYVDHIKAAAVTDRARWKDAKRPDSSVNADVVDNSDMESARTRVVNRLRDKTSWLAGKWGPYTTVSAEPERDNTPAAPLPDYARPSSITEIEAPDDIDEAPVYYNLQGVRIINPVRGQLYIRHTPTSTTKVIF